MAIKRRSSRTSSILGGTCVPRQIWTSHVLELAEDAYAMDSLLDALEKAATMGSKRRRRRLGLSSNKGESKILLEQRRYWGRHASEGPRRLKRVSRSCRSKSRRGGGADGARRLARGRGGRFCG